MKKYMFFSVKIEMFCNEKLHHLNQFGVDTLVVFPLLLIANVNGPMGLGGRWSVLFGPLAPLLFTKSAICF